MENKVEKPNRPDSEKLNGTFRHTRYFCDFMIEQREDGKFYVEASRRYGYEEEKMGDVLGSGICVSMAHSLKWCKDFEKNLKNS